MRTPLVAKTKAFNSALLILNIITIIIRQLLDTRADLSDQGKNLIAQCSSSLTLFLAYGWPPFLETQSCSQRHELAVNGIEYLQYEGGSQDE